jgi:hypothetical protein
VSATFAGTDWRKKRPFDQARVVVAERMADHLAEAVQGGRLDNAETPTEEDLSRNASRLVSKSVSLDGWVPYLVVFANDVPVAPFDIELAQAHALRALESLAAAALTDPSDHSPAEIVKLAAQAAKCGRGAVARGNDDSRWLFVLGVAVTGASETGRDAGIPARLARGSGGAGHPGCLRPG